MLEGGSCSGPVWQLSSFEQKTLRQTSPSPQSEEVWHFLKQTLSGGGGSSLGSKVAGTRVKLQMWSAAHSSVEPEFSQTTPTERQPAKLEKPTQKEKRRSHRATMAEVNHMPEL